MFFPGPSSLGARRPRGFTLIEIAVVLFILGVLIAMAAAVTRGVSAAQRRSLTATKMATVDAALVQYVQQKRRLPCPADGTLASTANNVGKEGAIGVAGCTNEQNGVIPWWDLGLSENDITDGWERRLTYRIDPALALNNALDMSLCDPAGGIVAGPASSCAACTAATIATCTAPSAFLQAKGLEVRSVGGTVLMNPNPGAPPYNGAAYVLISPGESGGGGYMGSGALAGTTSVDGTEEKKNYANLVMQPYYVDDTLSESPGATHFDDIVSRPSLLSVVTKAGLGPRSH